jgi:hypothetical protein
MPKGSLTRSVSIVLLFGMLSAFSLENAASGYTGSIDYPELFVFSSQKNANLETALLSISNSFQNNSVSVTQELLAAMLATLDKEVGENYLPVEEQGDYGMGPGSTYTVGGSRRSSSYDGGVDYKGRGYIQITHKENYQKYCGPDCVGTSTPELDVCGCKNQWYCTVTDPAICPQVRALQPDYAARIFTSYYIENNLVSLSNAKSYWSVGKAINGGDVYASDFNAKANAYLTLLLNNPDKTTALLTWLNSGTPATTRSPPSQVLSPVADDIEQIGPDASCSNTKWCFNQHQTGNTVGHIPGGGICQADDTYAWDANLNSPTWDSDGGQPVYATAGGVVCQTYGSCKNADATSSYGQVLIEHTNQGSKWWSGYVHLSNIQVTKGQAVTEDTIIGYVSSAGTDNNHLHFVVYSGENSAGKLKSFDAQILPRSGSQPVTLTLYVHDGSADGPVLSGVEVTGQDATGSSFSQTTDANGFVVITGSPGSWQFSATKDGYAVNSWSQGIAATCTKNAFLLAEGPEAEPETGETQAPVEVEVTEAEPTEPIAVDETFGSANSDLALKGDIYYLEEGAPSLPDFAGLTPIGTIYADVLDIPSRSFDSGFPGVTDRFEWFAIRYTGVFDILLEGEYAFRLISDDGSRLIIDGNLILDNDGQHSPKSVSGEVYLTQGQHLIEVEYFQGPRHDIALQLFWTPPGESESIFDGRGQNQLDSTSPSVQSFQVAPLGLAVGESFSIDYTISDIGGSGLKQVELWRKDETSDWQQINTNTLSGETGPLSGTFTDAPDALGKYWYGVHVVDNAGNWNDQINSNTNGQPSSFEPAEVEVKEAATAKATSQAPSEEWIKTFGGIGTEKTYSVQSTSDGGYILAGETSSCGELNGDAWLIKADSQGNKEWDKTIGGSGYDLAYSVQCTNDGGYILTGDTRSFGEGGFDIWLIKTDSEGQEIWSRTLGGGGDDLAYSVHPTNDDGYILAGVTESFGAGNLDVWLIKTDREGNEIWNSTFGGVEVDGGWFFNGEYGPVSVQPTSDGGYIIVAGTVSYGAGNWDAWLIKTDSEGNMLWNRTFGGDESDYAHYVQQTSDSGYILAGQTWSYGAGNGDAWLIKTDSEGNMLWNRTLGGSGTDNIYSVQSTSDGGYIIAGYTSIHDEDAWWVKTDSHGNKEWERNFGWRASRDFAYSVQQMGDGGFILPGSSEFLGNTGFMNEAWLIKVAPA